MPKKKTLDDFLSMAISVHGNIYDYSKTEYVNSRTKVSITCPIHGEFWQKPYDHISGHGCKKCKDKIKSEKRRMSIQSFVQRAHLIHNYKYDYSNVTFHSNKDKVTIVCPIHGEFLQEVNSHLQGHGCPICYNESRKGLIYGVGYNDLPNLSLSQSYKHWHSVILRAFDLKYKEKHPTYKDVKVCDEWLHFSEFNKWFEKNYIEGNALDKDILVKGNKIYSPETCCFVPAEINALITKNHSLRGKYPIGVTFMDGLYIARIGANREYLGAFNTKEEAFHAYKTAKEQKIKELANFYYNQGKITQKVYEALCSYKVDITD